MKKLRNILPLRLIILMAFILSILATITASAAKIGDPYSWYGVQIGWIFIIAAVILVFIFYYALKIGSFKKTLPIIAVLVGVGLLLALTDVAVEPVPAEITPGVTWSVTATEQQGGNITIDNDLNKITILCDIYDSGGTMNDTDATAFTVPIINFTISPTVTEGLTDTSLAATTIASVVNPDVSFTVSGTSYDLFSDVSGTTGDKDLMWTADGTDEYEWHYCTVTFGSSEVAELEINYNPAGISQLDVGTIKTTSISIGGVTYTMSLIIVEEVE